MVSVAIVAAAVEVGRNSSINNVDRFVVVYVDMIGIAATYRSSTQRTVTPIAAIHSRPK